MCAFFLTFLFTGSKQISITVRLIHSHIVSVKFKICLQHRYIFFHPAGYNKGVPKRSEPHRSGTITPPQYNPSSLEKTSDCR